MPEIFQRTATQLAGVFVADKGKLSFGGGVSTALVQQLQFGYSQNVARLYEIGNAGQVSNIYYVGGRTNGQLSIARVVGPSAVMGAFYAKFGNVCNAKGNHIRVSLSETDCSPPGGNIQVAYTCKFCVLTQIGITVAASDMIVNESAQIMYSGLDYQGP